MKLKNNWIKLPEPLHSLMKGVEKGAITNFYGPPGVGKTNLCMLSAIECIKNGGKVFYIDTEGGFSIERLNQIVNNESILKNIIIAGPKDFEEQGKLIRSLEKRHDIDMIVLDSAVALYRLECADPTKETLDANKELSIQLSVLSNIARKRNIPVIITAHTFKRENGENYIIGGYTIKYWSKSIVFLEHTGRMSERKATIVKHRSIPEGKSVKFMIVNEGVKPSGFRIF
ncbi:MAG: DNA repair and recombination protein RadB [Candidatus Aenigmarchaeota archaeon]|nr:DNA repair and recombination protein RadB [Candidatus Aenigmarchaeota archaeon]